MRKKMIICKKDDSQKSTFSIVSRGVGLSSDIWSLRKALKGSLQNIYLILDLLYHKSNSIITGVVDDSIFKKYIRLYLREKC